MKVNMLAELQHDPSKCIGSITFDSTNLRQSTLENERSRKQWTYIKASLFALFSEQHETAIYRALTPF